MRVLSETLIEPVPQGHEYLNVTDVAFLIEHEPSGKRIMFDLGIRKDYWNFPPFMLRRLAKMIPSLRIDKDVSEILEEKGIALSSIYTPGHCTGHMCGLARTSPDPNSTFILMGGDIAHFSGDIRPQPEIPVPEFIPEDVLDVDPTYFPVPCPGSLFTDHNPLIEHFGDAQDPRITPFYNVSTGPLSSYANPKLAQQSVDRLKNFDVSEDVLVCLAHDGSLLEKLPVFNTSPELDLNTWKNSGWKQKAHWGWLNELPRNKQPGRRPIIDGYWRYGKQWSEARQELVARADMLARSCGDTK
ncbi:hypothetical protein H2204_000358 [Knufia peltigerae]|uniref:Metallo-beta-lactamase domain-containing protein n=1 Tax=Knufia peltigerae TaxID=1002370 RepID=A0AA39D3C0_9EURO|nr:hypothetical protein H2204_000358 [Knufia peltigerae]